MSKTLDIKSFCLNKSSLIEASAGTGKTYTITYLVLRLLLGSGTDETALPEGPLPLENILIVTFTNAATSDLRARVREKIRQARLVFEAYAKGERIEVGERQMLDLIEEFERKNLPFKDGARILLRAERSIDDAAICTIHSFCNRALNQIYAFEAGQAFEKTLTDDVSYYENLACRQVWRELFYRTSEESRLVLSALKLKEPQDLRQVAKILQDCRLSNPRAQVQGYALRNYEYLSPKRKSSSMVKELFSRLAQAKSGEIAAIKALFDDFAKAVPLETLKGMLKRDDKGKWRIGEVYKTVSAKSKTAIKKGPGTFIEALIEFYSQGGSCNDKALQDMAGAVLMTKKDGSYKVAPPFVARSDLDTYLAEYANGAQLNALEAQIAALPDNYLKLLAQNATLTNEFTAALGIYVQNVLEQILDEHKLMSNDEVLRDLDYALNHRRSHSDELSALIRERYRVAMIDEFQDTDPTQFAIFERLYLREEAKGRARCYLIGDPKQSIYAFRGSDINSYLKAKAQIQRLYDDSVYTLDTNYRSDPKVVAGVNELFGRNDNPFENESIGFDRVNAQSGKLHFHFEGEESCGSYMCCLPQGPEKINQEDLKDGYAKACAFKILQILKHGVIEDKNGSRKVRPSDIAILVRNVKENNAISKALRALNLSSVYFSDQQSVLRTSDKTSYGEPARPSDAALAMLALIEAMARPYHRDKLKRLLGSALLSKSGEEFEASLQEDSFEQEVMILYEASRRWREGGFLSAFSWWITHPLHQGIQKQLSLMGGERLLTDCYHIAEIMQEAHGSKGGLEAQVRYYRELMDEDRGDVELNSKGAIKRLESERSQIQVRTIHNSKGLEFPIVLMPFMWTQRRKDMEHAKMLEGVLYYDGREGMRMLDLKSEPESRQCAQEDNAAESVRLTYVALTRACAANFLFISDPRAFKEPPDSLVKLLSAGSGYEEIIAEAGRLGFAVERIDPAIISGDLEIAPYEPQAQESQDELKPSVLPEGAVDSSFVITSYTDVVRGIGRNLQGASLSDDPGEGYAPLFDADKNDDEDEQRLSLQGKERKILDCRFTFPRGSLPGLFLHSLLEHTPFNEFKLREDLVRAVAAKLGTACLPDHELPFEDERQVDNMVIKLLRVCHEALQRADGALLQEWIESGSLSHGEGALSRSLASWLCDMVYAPLADRSLSEVQQGDFVPEMRYLLPARNLDLTKLNEVVVEHNQRLWRKLEDLGQAPAGFKLSDLGALPADTVAGFVTGSLDLVCAFCDSDGHKRYSVIDYKSNHLGFGKSDYNLKAMAASIFEHRYDVQLLFYTLALKRYLQARMRDFDYKRDMGSVHYLFLRGMSTAGSGHYGVFSHQVDEDIVQRMDELFGTEERL